MTNKSNVDDILKKIAKGASISFIGSGLGMFFAYLSMMIIARHLGASDFGLISLASAVVTIASTLVLVGMPEGVVRHISFYKGKNDDCRLKGTIYSAVQIVLPLGVITSGFLFVFAYSISSNVFNEPSLTPILRIFSISIPFSALSYIFIYALGGLQEMKYMVYVRDVLQNSAKLFSLLILLILGFGVYGAAFAYTFSIIVTPFAALYYLMKIFPIFEKKIKVVSLRRELFAFSWPLMFAGVFGILMGWLDTLMVGYFLTTADVGIYRASFSTATLLSLIPTSFGAIFFPIITELFARNEGESLNRTNSTVTKWIFIITLPLVLLLTVFSTQILYLLYGIEYVRGGIALSILAFGYLFIATTDPTRQMLQVVGLTKLVMINTSFGLILDAILNFYLIPRHGILGAAVATSVSLLAMNLLAFLEVYYYRKIQPLDFKYFKIIVACLLPVIFILLLSKYYFLQFVPIIYFMLMIFFCISLYSCLLLVFRILDEKDISVMIAIEDKLGLRSGLITNIMRRFV